MYENPLFVYREYIQNSVDQIDKAVELGLLKSREDGNISISINKWDGIISIKDNGTGISEKEVLPDVYSIKEKESEDVNK